MTIRYVYAWIDARNFCGYRPMLVISIGSKHAKLLSPTHLKVVEIPARNERDFEEIPLSRRQRQSMARRLEDRARLAKKWKKSVPHRVVKEAASKLRAIA